MVINSTTTQSILKISWITIMFACRIFSQAEMEQAQLSELLMQITRLNKLDTIFLNSHWLPRVRFYQLDSGKVVFPFNRKLSSQKKPKQQSS